MSATNQMQGARLEYVLRKITGKVERSTVKWDPKQKKLVRHTAAVGDMYMLYLPTGHSYRLTHDQVLRGGYDRQPAIMNIETVNKPDTAAGQFKFAINDEMRQNAWRKLEDEIVKRSIRKHGAAERSIEESVNGESAA